MKLQSNTFSRAERLVVFKDKLLVYQAGFADATAEAILVRMPVAFLVSEALGVRENALFAAMTGFGECYSIATHAIGLAVFAHVALSTQQLITFETAKMLQVVVFSISYCVFLSNYQLEWKNKISFETF